MKRRDFLRLTALTPLVPAAPRAHARAAEAANGWRAFELHYAVDLSAQPGPGRLWLPLPATAGDHQRVRSVTCSGGPATTALYWDPVYQAPTLAASWGSREGTGDGIRRLDVHAVVATRDRGRAPARRSPLPSDAAALYLRPTEHIPTDGIVADTAAGIVRGLRDPDERARAVYDWVVDHTFRDPKTRGCGRGDIRFMLESGDLGGKCADINSLFVGLVRAAGLPAREVYGVRVAESAQFKSLGKSGDVSRAQHCRAEYFSPRHGWVPVDAADVRKAVLEEKLPLGDPRIVALCERLFGYWEMNWVGFNSARDFELAPRAGDKLAYFMYPYAEFGDTRLDGRDPEAFRFSLDSREVSPAA